MMDFAVRGRTVKHIFINVIKGWKWSAGWIHVFIFMPYSDRTILMFLLKLSLIRPKKFILFNSAEHV